MESVDIRAEELESKLEDWGQRLDELATQGDQTEAVGRLNHRERIDDLRAKHEVVIARLREFRAATADNGGIFWAAVRLERARRRLEEADELVESK